MRGVRFLILLVIGIRSAAYAYHDVEEGPGRRHAETRQGVQRRRRQDRRDRSEVGIGRSDDACGRRARTGRSSSPSPRRRTRRRCPASPRTSRRSRSSGSSTRIRPDLKEFGLDTPRVEVAFKADGQQRRLQIGQKTPAGTDVYAKLRRQQARLLGSVLSRLDVQPAARSI